MERIKIVKSQIKSEIENGMTRKELSEKYGLSVGQINKALKQLNLDSMRAKVVKFELENDDEVEISNVEPVIEPVVAEPMNPVINTESNPSALFGRAW